MSSGSPTVSRPYIVRGCVILGGDFRNEKKKKKKKMLKKKRRTKNAYLFDSDVKSF